MMKRSQTAEGKRRRRRIMLWSLVLIVACAMVLPLSGYVYTSMVHAQEASQQAADEAATNPRAEYWRQVRRGVEGYTAVTGQETDVLVQSRGQVWREVRNGPVSTYGAWAVVGVLGLIVIFHLVFGTVKLEKRTGRKILRWSVLDRVLHWYTAILFIILAITGLSILWGRAVLIPVLGKEGFAAWANFAKPVHDYLAIFFSVGLVLMLLIWIKDNIPSKVDWEWLKKGGGYFGDAHPPAGYVNAGEKLWFWILFVGGITLIVSGVYMLFPNMGFSREVMQNANVLHNISGLLLIAFVFGHIYLGSLGNEGSFEGMWTGEVDEQWAKQHHGLWYEEVRKEGGKQQPEAAASDVSTVAST